MDIIDVIIPEGNLAIDIAYGYQLLTNFKSELQQIQLGIPYSALGHSEKREKSATKIVEIQNPNKTFVKDKIAIVNLSGLIKAEDGMSSLGTKTIGEQLLAVKKDVIGALFRIDTGGGYVSGAEAMISAMREFGKPIVALSQMALSAGFMIASEAQQIFAETEFSKFGSIGVYIPLSKIEKEAINKFMDFAYSTASPNKNKASRDYVGNDDLTAYIQEATRMDEMFMAQVKTNRRLKGSQEETLSGSVFFAEDSIKRGLIDGISNYERSLQTIQKLSKT